MIALQPPLVQAIFNRNAEEVQLLLHKKEDVNALVCTMYTNFNCITGSYHEGLVPVIYIYIYVCNVILLLIDH